MHGGSLRIVGAGLGRTGTNSLKLALERLTGGRCYHMLEVFERPQDTAAWRAAAREEWPDWNALLAGFDATVDWPACAFWRQLAAANSDALVLLSVRESPQVWWGSVESTIFTSLQTPVPDGEPEWSARRAMVLDVLAATFTPDWHDREAAIAAYERHNAAVRAAVPAERLVEWQPGDGWQPLCRGLGLAVPDEPFPHTNTAEEFRATFGAVPTRDE